MSQSVSAGTDSSLLNEAHWFTQTTALLTPRNETGEQLELTALSFSLSDEDREAFQAIVSEADSPTFKYAASWLVGETTGADWVDPNSVAYLTDDAAASEFIQTYVQSLSFGEGSPLVTEAIQQFRFPVFGSPPEDLETILDIATAASGVIAAVAVIGAGTTLAIIAGPTALIIGIPAGIGTIGVKSWKLIKKRRERRARRQQQVEDSTRQPEATNEESAEPQAKKRPKSGHWQI